MSLIWQCVSCGGSYADLTPDGCVYAHACPPEIRSSSGDLVVNPNPRNENLALDKRGMETGIRTEGAGTRCLSNSTLLEPGWITNMKSRVAKREESND
jgi:hypothetical protein